MIRIDEIYNNVIWAWVKEHNKNSRLFYCDPPGTSDPSNLFNHGSHTTEENSYILLHDQEPLYIADIHRPLFNKVIKCNRDILIRDFNRGIRKKGGYGTIIVSEKDSDNLERTKKEYQWESHYYFYHGWASLDWYRGYNRTFLIQRARDRTPTKTFISPNRIIGGKRDHRVLFLYHIFKHKMANNHISAPEICPEENVYIQNIAEKYIKKYPNILNIFNDAELPHLFNGENTQTMSSCWLTNFDESADSLFYVPTETVYFGRRLHLTEKTFKPIVLEMPFILVATQGSLEYLRSYGFKTFNGIIDESYDEEVDDFIRLEKVTKLLSDINNLSVLERQEIHKQCLPIIEHNYNHFYFGGFEEILWKELTNMLNELL